MQKGKAAATHAMQMQWNKKGHMVHSRDIYQSNYMIGSYHMDPLTWEMKK